jgi:hypothetical protein
MLPNPATGQGPVKNNSGQPYWACNAKQAGHQKDNINGCGSAELDNQSPQKGRTDMAD